MSLRKHGGGAPAGTIDFSAPRNPLGASRIALKMLRESMEASTRYPDPEYRELRTAIASYYDIGSAETMILNGAAEALTLLLAAFRPRNLIVLEPTFGDHWMTAEGLGIKVVPILYSKSSEEFTLDPHVYLELPAARKAGSMLLLSNPNNPTGHLASRKLLVQILEGIPSTSVIVVDEAFMELSDPSQSLLGVCDERLVVLRSFTKTLALPGLRVGFLHTCNDELLRKLDAVRQPWNVNAIAERMIVHMLNEHPREYFEYVDEAMRMTDLERGFLTEALEELNLTVYRSRAPFILVHHEISHPKLQGVLVKYGVYVRDASSFYSLDAHYSRISVLTREDNRKLVETFKRATEGC